MLSIWKRERWLRPGGPAEVVADKGYHSRHVVRELATPKFGRTFPSRDEDVSTGLVGNSSSRPCMRIDGGREANAADDYSDSAVRSWSE